MPEKLDFLTRSREANEENRKVERLEQLIKNKNIEQLTPQERAEVKELAYFFLNVKKNSYRAARGFRILQDFEGLRKLIAIAKAAGSTYDLPIVLTELEEYDTLHDWIDSQPSAATPELTTAFKPLLEPLVAYVRETLAASKTPVATGMINKGVDLVALRNLAQKYDIAVPIARGGLPQGMIARLWGLPTKTMDIAAHNRKVARGKWVDPVLPEDFAGKRVLFFDKDAVSGASIRKAVKMVQGFKPASMAVYFTHNALAPGEKGLGTRLDGVPPELEVYYPAKAPLENRGDALFEAHERLGTLYGRRRLIQREFEQKIIPSIVTKHPKVARAVEDLVARMLSAYDNLNPFLKGVDKVRETSILQLQRLQKDFFDGDVFGVPGTDKRLEQMFAAMPDLPPAFEQILLLSRYEQQIQEAGKKKGVDNPHLPAHPLAAWRAAYEASQKGYDVALIVGPEGFAYEPFFQDFGLPSVAITIPESAPDKPRTITLADKLDQLKGKKVLVVEDDVRTGATLKKILEALATAAPAELGLYLGQPQSFQIMKSIPAGFSATFMAREEIAPKTGVGSSFLEFLRSRGNKIFKTDPNLV